MTRHIDLDALQEAAAFLEVSAAVRYWEDATVNGQEDTNGHIPLRKGENWEPVIELATGRVLDWPDGVEAGIHYKVCDAGEYWLLDAEKRRVAKWKGYYVPDRFLCVGNNGYGDYIIFTIGRNGAIIGWRRPDIDPEQWAVVSAGRAAPEGGKPDLSKFATLEEYKAAMREFEGGKEGGN